MPVISGGSGGGGTSGQTFIGKTVLSGSAVSLAAAAIPGTFQALRMLLTLRSDVVAVFDTMWVQFNADTTAGNYDQAFSAQGTSGGTGGTATQITGASSSASQFAVYDLIIPQYAATVAFKAWSAYGFHDRTSGSAFFAMSAGGVWKNTAAIAAITVVPGTGPNFVAGSSLVLYGLSAT